MNILTTKESVLQPIVSRMPLWITPNGLTWFRLLLVIPLSLLLFRTQLIPALFVFIVALVCDLLDGPLARLRKQSSVLGSVIDPIADKILLAAVFVPLGAFLLPFSLFAAIIILEITIFVGSAMVSSLMFLRKKILPPLKIPVFGKYKMALYSVGCICLFLSVAMPWLDSVAMICFVCGWLASLISTVQQVVES